MLIIAKNLVIVDTAAFFKKAGNNLLKRIQ